jgi:uncharacterized protein (TIGR02687 family)
MSNNSIENSLRKLFEKHRIVFWYDNNGELNDQFQEVQIPGVEKVAVHSNEFEIKHRIHKSEPTGLFLLYFQNEKPTNEDNWLLDVELAHHVFQTDQEAMFLQELGLSYHLKELVSNHLEFFKSRERRLKLKDLLGTDDEHQAIRYKMLAVLFNSENISLITFIHAHGSGFSQDSDRFDKELLRYNLFDFYWGAIKRSYNYNNPTPSIYDFLLEVFQHNFVLGSKNNLSKESRLLLSLWKDTFQYRDYFSMISDRIAADINVENSLNKATIDQIISDDLFKLTEQKIIHELVLLIASDNISKEKAAQYIKARTNKYWFVGMEHFYQSITSAIEMISQIREYKTNKYKTFQDGVQDYTSAAYEVDQHYRKFIWNYRKTNQNRILAELAEMIEKIYSNDWLLLYNNNWQSLIDNLTSWPTQTHYSQQQFFNIHVKPVIEKKQRLFVIISDALRFECGVELSKRLLSENRYEAVTNHMVSSLPSYTQLGMASLLPHKELTIQDGTDTIFADGMSSAGIQGRSKILESNSGVRATAITASDFMKLNANTTGREFVKQYDLIYIYHNRIDKTGDDKTTEERVFDAVEDELVYLIEMTRKIANMNGNNMIVTSDHGFIYQHNEILDSDYSISGHTGTVWKENRRFVIGQNIIGDVATKAFKGKDLGIASEIDILIPKSINRLRIKGAGSRFIHGGASLQEIVIPVVSITKKRQNTTSQVDIDIIKSTDRITTNILAVSFIQTDLVTEQTLPRLLRVAIYAEDGELLSDQFKYTFDNNESSERQREVKHLFQLGTKATGKYKNQRVKLVLEEPVEGTSKWKNYKEYFYTLNISFTNDFDA